MDGAELARHANEKHIIESFEPFVHAIELYNCLKLRNVSGLSSCFSLGRKKLYAAADDNVVQEGKYERLREKSSAEEACLTAAGCVKSMNMVLSVTILWLML